MAERTAAEVLAMLQDELAKQEAARQLFESDREPRPTGQTVKGIPEAEENLLKAIASPFVPIERDVIREPQSTFETVDRLVPGAMDGEALRQEEVRTLYTPGVYGDARLASPPIVDAISSGLRFGDELLFGTPEQKRAARTTLREGIAGLPGLPQEMVQSMMRGAESIDRGGVVTRDAEGNISRPSDYLVGLAGVTAGGTLATGLSSQSATGVVAGLFGGKKAKSGQEAEETVGMIEQQGLTPEEGWARQAGTNRYKAYRSDIDDQVRFEIPMQNAKLAPAKKEMEFPDPRDISKLPQVEQEKLLLDLQGLRTKTVTLPNGEERTRLFIPDVFTLPESTLNKLGFTRLDSASGDFTKFADLTLEQLVDFPELFEEYPQLRTYRVQRMPTLPAAFGTRGSFNPETKTFRLADVEATPEGRRDFMSVLMHEIQHAIQEIEGFERGSSVGGVKPIGHDKTKKKLEADLREKEKQLSERLAAIGIDDDFFTVMQNFPDAPLNATNNFFNKLFGPKRKTIGELGKNYQMTDFDKNLYEGLDRVKPFRELRYSVFNYLESRAKEANQKAQGLVTDAEKGRAYKERRIKEAAEQARYEGDRIKRAFKQGRIKDTVSRVAERGRSANVKKAIEEEKRRFIGYTGSDFNLIMINRRLKEDFGLPAAQAEKFTEQISSAFDDVIPELRPLMMKQAQIKEIDNSLFGIYQAAPGEVEARNVGLRAMGVKKGQVIDPEQDANPVQLPGESIVKARSRARAERDYSPEELELMFPGETQKMVTPVGGFKKFEGSPKDLTPGERLSMSQRTPRELEKLLLDKRLSLIKSLNEDSFGTTPAEVARNRKRVDREIRDLERRIRELRQDPSYAGGGAVRKFSTGGEAFRDPLMEERGYAFDPERNAYYEDLIHPEYGPIRSYFSPRDQSPVPLLSDARQTERDFEIGVSNIADRLRVLERREYELGQEYPELYEIARDGLAFDILKGRVREDDVTSEDLEAEADEFYRQLTEKRGVQIVPEAMQQVYSDLQKKLSREERQKSFDDIRGKGIRKRAQIEKANGGMVNNMRKPVLSRGLSGLLSNYTSGPLARMSVPRETPQGMFRGGAPGMRGVGFRGPQRIPEIDQSAITAALANLPTPTERIPEGIGTRGPTLEREAAPNIPPPPPVPTNIAIQTPSPSPVTAAETLAAAPVPRRVAATPVAQALTGSRPTDFLGYETTEGAAEMGATAPGQTPFEPGVLITEPTGPTAEEIAAQQAAERAAAQAAAEEAARLEAERLAAEEAARIAAEQEAARIQQEQLAAEQLAAQQAAEAAAAAEAQRQAELEAQRQAELEAQRQAEILAQQEAERIAQEQAAQEAAAEQAAAQLAAEQLAAQEAAAQAEAQRLAEEEAARIAAEEAAQAEAQRIADEAAAEAERVRLAQIAEAEKLAEEQRLAELAAQEAARQEEERLAAEQLAAQEAAAQAAALAEQEAERIRQEEIAAALAQQEAAEAAERERVLAEIAERQRLEDEAAALAEQEALAAAQAEAAAAEQLAAEQLAAQQAADLAAQQNLEQQALAAEQLAAQQAAEQSALEAQIAATPDPDPVYTPPTQTEIDQAATVAQTEAGDLFTTPTDTGEVIDRGGFGTVEPVTTTTTTTTDAAQADPVQQQNTPAVITQASDGTFHPTPAAAAAYEQQLAAQKASGISGLTSLLTRPNFDVSQAISDYTSGYDSSRDKTFRRTFYPFQELTDEQKENAYIAEVFKPVADVSRFRPALTFGETAGTTTGTTGTDTSGVPTGNVNTGAAASAPGQYGLAMNEMYQCPPGYVLAFENGRATCKSTKTAGGPGGRKDVPPEVVELSETG